MSPRLTTSAAISVKPIRRLRNGGKAKSNVLPGDSHLFPPYDPERNSLRPILLRTNPSRQG